MNTFVLVHGAWHGKWCWEKVTALLESSGNRAIAIDLPGHGEDTTPLKEVTMESYVQRVTQVINEIGHEIILVGHSLGGGIITQVAENIPSNISRLIYLAGVIPQSGQTLLDVVLLDENSLIIQNQIPSEDNLGANIRQEAITEIFYGDCAAEDASRAISMLTTQPLAPVTAALNYSEKNFGSIPKVYLKTLQDKAIIPRLQDLMIEHHSFENVLELDTGHCPFISNPGLLAEHLMTF